MMPLLDGGDFTSKFSVKMKCKNFDVLKQRVKVNNKAVILVSFKLFQRLSLAAERQLSLVDSLSYELTILPTSIFDDHHFMRESKKFRLGNFLKDKVGPLTDICPAGLTIIDGGWLLHQLPWEKNKCFLDIGAVYVTLVNSKTTERLLFGV